MYRFDRVFCATAWELEAERRAFYDALGAVNETHAMPHGVLYNPISLVNCRDKRAVQYAVEENIRDCAGYLVALDGGWGPPECNFERDYHVARRCAADPSLPMRGVEVLVRAAPDGSAPAFSAALDAAGIAHQVFRDTADFRERAAALLTAWLPEARAANA